MSDIKTNIENLLLEYLDEDQVEQVISDICGVLQEYDNDSVTEFICAN